MANHCTFRAAKAAPKTANIEDRNFTIGCELECILVCSKNPTSNKAVNGEALLKILLSRPFESSCAHCHKKYEWQLPIFNKSKHDPDGTKKDAHALYWHIDRERGEDFTSFEEKHAIHNFKDRNELQSVEIKTRKFEFDFHSTDPKGKCKKHEILYQDEITAVLDRLNKDLLQFDVKDMSSVGEREGLVYLYVNGESALHVHVGSHEHYFPVQTVKHLLSICLVWERQIDSLHSRNRITGTYLPTADPAPKTPVNSQDPKGCVIHSDVYNRPLSVFFSNRAHKAWINTDDENRIQKKSEPRFGYNLDSWLALITGDNVKTIYDVRTLYDNVLKVCVVNLYNLTPGPENNPQDWKKQTLEFRQHCGTLDPTEVLSCIDVVTKMVKCCQYTTAQVFQALFKAGGKYRNLSLDGVDVLKELQCNDSTIEHHKARKKGQSERMKRLNFIRKQAENVKSQNDVIGSLACLASCNIENELANDSNDKIQETIREKLLKGGYGQFNDKDLDQLLPKGTDPETRAKLRIGWISTKAVKSGKS